MTKKQCYNCGHYFDKNRITREHIPAKNLFAGYDEKYKVNRITVPACKTCNNSYSPSDDEFRNMIGIITKKKKDSEITKKSVRSILKKDSKLTRLHFNNLGKVSGVTFNEIPIEEFHKKNFKGLFFHEFNKALPKIYELIVNIDENDWSEGTMAIIGYLKNNFNWKHSGHPDIFSYILQPLRDNLNNTDKKDIEPIDNEYAYLALLDYNRTHTAMVIAINKELLIKERKLKGN